jgi:hypothetical protein
MGSVARQLSSLFRRRASGRFHLIDGTRLHWIQVHAGLISGARFAGEFDPLGKIFVQSGRINGRDLKRSLEQMTRCERPQGQLLREMGLVTSREVELALRQQLEWRMSRLLALGDRVRLTSTTTTGRQRRPVGPCRPLHPHTAIWRHVRALSHRQVDRLLDQLGGPFRLLPGESPPLWLPGLDGAALARAIGHSFFPRSLPPNLRRPALFLHETGVLVQCRNPVDTEAPATTETLPTNASRDELRRAYRRLALQLHPDRHPRASEAERASLALRFARVTEAYRRLTVARTADNREDLTAS